MSVSFNVDFEALIEAQPPFLGQHTVPERRVDEGTVGAESAVHRFAPLVDQGFDPARTTQVAYDFVTR